MNPLKTKFVSQWVYRGCLQGHEWEVPYRSKDSSGAAVSLKSTSTWLTNYGNCIPGAHLEPLVGSSDGYSSLLQVFLFFAFFFPASVFWGGTLLNLVVSGTSCDFWVVYFPSLKSVLPRSWKKYFNWEIIALKQRPVIFGQKLCTML